MATSLIDLDYITFDIPNKDEINNEILSRIIPMSLNPKTGDERTNRGGWQSPASDYDKRDDNPAYDMNRVVDPIIQRVYSEYDKLVSNMTFRKHINTNYNLYYWFNVNYEGDYNVDHCHAPIHPDSPPVLLSGCYYIHVPEESGKFVFRGIKEHLKPYFENRVDDAMLPKSGECMLFCPSKTHYVETSASKDLRISMAFDLILG